LPLIVAAVWALIGGGLLRLHNWARWVTMLAAVWGIASILANAVVFSVHFDWSLPRTVAQIAVQAAVLWYLFRRTIADRFSKGKESA